MSDVEKFDRYPAYQAALMQHHDTHERLPALFEVHADLDQSTFWKLLKMIMRVTPVIGPHQEILRRMLTAERCNGVGRIEAWTKDDFEWIKRLVSRKKPLKVYRGGSIGFGTTGFNWTTKYDRAHSFALRTGFNNAIITVGRVDPTVIMIPEEDNSDIFVFPEHVKIERQDDVVDIDPGVVYEAQLRIAAGVHGGAFVVGMTPGENFKLAIEQGRRNKELGVRQLHESRELLTELGFKKRITVIDEMLEKVADAVQGDMSNPVIPDYVHALRSEKR